MMVLSNHQLISLLSYSCVVVLAIIPVMPYSLTTFFPLRNTLSRIQCNHSFNPKPSSYHSPTCSVLYSSNPTGRKRRRRKDTTSEDTNTNESTAPTIGMGDEFNMAGSDTAELPDFDIIDDAVIPTSTVASKNTKQTTGSTSFIPTPTTVDPLIGTITPNMMASAPATNRAVTNTILSVNELRDRSLEQKLESLYEGDPTLKNAEQQVIEELPDLITLQKERKKVTTEQILLSASSMSKKERQALARQQQDMEQQSKRTLSNDQGEKEENLFSKLPFITNESGKIEPIKLLEAATWTCIIALVLWELYINSPLFTRAAPIIPVVYEIWI